MNHDELRRVVERLIRLRKIYRQPRMSSTPDTTPHDGALADAAPALLAENKALRRAVDAGRVMRELIFLEEYIVDECVAFDAAVNELDESKNSLGERDAE